MVPQEKIEALVSTLTNNADFTAVVGDKLFPLVLKKAVLRLG